MNVRITLKAGLLLLVLAFLACENKETHQSQSNDDQADGIIAKAIEAMGGDVLDHAEATFNFRDQSLSYYNNEGNFRYTRTFTDSAGYIVTDTLTNKDFIRYRNHRKLKLTSEEKAALQGGVNSIIYFAFLPYRLNDPAVKKEYIDQVKIKDNTLEKIKVTFMEEAGGADHGDVYYYYFDPEDYSLDYLAYKFHVDGGGIRFRSAYNERLVNGLTIRDYINYEINPDSAEYSRIEDYYNKNQMDELSRIELKNVQLKELAGS